MLAAMGGLALGGAIVLLIAMLLATGEAGRLDPVTKLETLGEPLDPFADVASGVSAPEAPVIGGQPDELVVDVAGAVMEPGLHRLGGGARVGDAIEAAGGFGPRVDLGAASQVLNLAQPLEDGVKVLVPELGIDDVTPRNEADGRIDLNNASQDELESLPGIGPVTAAKIIAARAQSPFKSVPDVRARGVVGQSVFDDIADLVRVSP